MDRKIKIKIKEYFFITVGIIIVALSQYFFLIPHDIAAGGAMGIAMITNNYFPFLSVGFIMLIVNIILFTIAFLTIGSKFGVKTIYASLGLSGTISILEKVFPIQAPITNDILLSTIIGTILSGLGMAVIFDNNASSGGTDILAKIINRYLHIDIGKSLLIIDFVVTLFAALTFGVEKGLYAIVAVISNGYFIDYAIEGFNVAMQVFIMSDEIEVISDYIMNELERGVTFFTGQGAYSGEEKRIMYTVISRRQFIRLREYIKSVDPKAFISVSASHEVLGEGFTEIDDE